MQTTQIMTATDPAPTTTPTTTPMTTTTTSTTTTTDDRAIRGAEMSTPTRGQFAARITAGRAALQDGLLLTALAVWEAVLVLWLALCACLVVVGVGLWLLPPALEATRAQSRRQRRLALRLSGVRVAETYRPDPARTDGPLPAARRWATRLGDPASRRDLLWHVADPVVGGAIAVAPLALLAHGVFGLLLPLLWRPVVSRWDNSWYGFVPVDTFAATLVAFVLGLGTVVLAVVVAPWFVRLHARWARAVLATQSRDALEGRVDDLARTRSEAVDHEADAIRRIERDLHDGAQARLVAMGMTLSAAERLVERDPAAALALVQEAKAASSTALTELRELVRGIHPPVLADRGLVDAVRSLALQSPLQVTVVSDLPGRPSAAVESAVYFAVSELLANALKHSGATAVDVTIGHVDGVLTATVTDDGRGGATLESGGSGLTGVEARLAAFDGDLRLTSPAGGPTAVTVLVPCALGVTAR